MMTTQEMMRAKARPGYWWVNTAKIDEAPDWVEQVAPREPNLLFGHEPAVLMAKQYKPTKNNDQR